MDLNELDYNPKTMFGIVEKFYYTVEVIGSTEPLVLIHEGKEVLAFPNATRLLCSPPLGAKPPVEVPLWYTKKGLQRAYENRCVLRDSSTNEIIDIEVGGEYMLTSEEKKEFLKQLLKEDLEQRELPYMDRKVRAMYVPTM